MEDFVKLLYEMKLEELNSIKSLSSSENQFFDKHDGKGILVRIFTRLVPPMLHSHEAFEFSYVLEGYAKQTIGESSFYLKKGDFFILSPGIEHFTERNDEYCIILSLLITKNTIEDLFKDLFKFNGIVSDFFKCDSITKSDVSWLLFHLMENEPVRENLINICKEDYKKEKYSEEIKLAVFSSIMFYILRKYEDNIITKL